VFTVKIQTHDENRVNIVSELIQYVLYLMMMMMMRRMIMMMMKITVEYCFLQEFGSGCTIQYIF
jgi:hypothetical protein